MIFDSFLIFAGIAILSIALAEFGKKPAFGLAGSALFIILGFAIYSDGLQIQTGEITTFSGFDNTTKIQNMTSKDLSWASMRTPVAGSSETNTTAYLNQSTKSVDTMALGHTETTSKIYSNMPNLSWIATKDFLGLIFNVLGLAGLLFYSLTPWGGRS